MDHEFRRGSRLTARYSINDERGRVADAFPVRPFLTTVRAQQAAFGYTTAGSSWLNQARASFTRLRVFNIPASAFQSDVARDLGVTGLPSDPFSYGLPYFLITSVSTVTDSPTLPQTQRDNSWNFSDGVSLNRGRHTWKFGGDLGRFQLNYLRTQFVRGRYIFTGAFTGDGAPAGAAGDPVADFLLGFPQVTDRTVGSTQAYLQQNTYAGYLQDDWRVNNRLTINLGLRYEYVSPFREKRGNLLNLDYSGLPAPPRLVRVETPVSPDRNNWAPRVGLALRPLDRHGLVFRAGYGLYFSPEIATETYDLIRNGIRNEQNTSDGSQAPVLTLASGFPETASTGFPGYFGLDPGARTPYVQQWSAGFQELLPTGIVVEVAYVGTKGTRLGRFRQFNTPLQGANWENLDPRPGNLQQLRPFPQLGEIIQREHLSNSIYHSLQLKAEKRMSKRFTLLASLVWSKSIDDSDSIIPGGYGSVGAQDERNLRLERGALLLRRAPPRKRRVRLEPAGRGLLPAIARQLAVQRRGDAPGRDAGQSCLLRFRRSEHRHAQPSRRCAGPADQPAEIGAHRRSLLQYGRLPHAAALTPSATRDATSFQARGTISSTWPSTAGSTCARPRASRSGPSSSTPSTTRTGGSRAPIRTSVPSSARSSRRATHAAFSSH